MKKKREWERRRNGKYQQFGFILFSDHPRTLKMEPKHQKEQFERCHAFIMYTISKTDFGTTKHSPIMI